MQHTYSCLYGTFLANNPCEREKRNIYKRTCSVWALLRAGNKNFHNFLYTPGSEMVSPALIPQVHLGGLRGAVLRQWEEQGPRGLGRKGDPRHLQNPGTGLLP